MALGGRSYSGLGQAYFCLCVDVNRPSRHSERVRRDGEVHREVNGDLMGSWLLLLDVTCSVCLYVYVWYVYRLFVCSMWYLGGMCDMYGSMCVYL